MTLQNIKGIGKRKEEILNSMGIMTPMDLIYMFPKKIEDRRKALEPRLGSTGSFCGRLNSKEHWRSRGGLQSLKLHFAWQGDVIQILFFNASYLDKKFSLGKDYYFYGELQQSGIHFSMVHPVFAQEDWEDFLTLTPIYPYRKGLAQKDMASFIKLALEIC